MQSATFKRIGECSTLAACLLAAMSIAKADAVVTPTEITYGTVTLITSGSVNISVGCDAATVKTVAWENVQSVLFDRDCRSHEIRPPTAGLLPCSQARQVLLKIYFGSESPPAFATTVLMQNGLVKASLAKNGGILSGPTASIAAISRLNICPTELPEEPTGPSTFCLEPVQLAVNWSLQPAMPNTVFTKGLAVFVDGVGLPGEVPPGSVTESVRGALGTALTVWTSGLLRYRNRMSATVNQYLDTILSRGANVSLLVSPQVIRVKCRENASLIVRVSYSRDSDFPVTDVGYIAKSQLQGRTVLLNAVDHQFRYTLNRGAIPAGFYDLTTVMAHELGHSFGLRDEFLGRGKPSIMNPDELADEATEADALKLAAVLQESVKGSAPGFFNATQCSGLRVRSPR